MPAGSAVITVRDAQTRSRPMRSVKWAWTSDGSGNVNGFPMARAIGGKVVNLVTKPGAGGVAPTDNYDVQILDEIGRDILDGKGMNRDTANTETVSPRTFLTDGGTPAITDVGQIAVDDILNLVITNAGAAKQGIVVLYLE